MDRRDFFKKAGRNANPRISRRIASGLAPYAGSWTVNEVSHLLKRTMFGAKKADIDYFLGRSVDQAVDELLNNIPSSYGTPLRDYGLLEDDDGVMHDDLGVAQGQTWVNDLNTVSNQNVLGAINSRRVDSLHRWWAGLIINQNRSIWEKMVVFWQHHFSVQELEVGNATMLWRHHNLLRSNALGNVKQLVRDVTTDPAMLIHLNGSLNSRLAPDENYARELQELFTIGQGSGSQYTENDVIAAARVLTGWRIDSDTLTSYLDTGAHDNGSKSFSSFYNSTTISGGNGAQELDDLVNMIFNTTECARFICRKLYYWFVYYQIDTATENDVITPLADILRSNNYNVRPVLSALFKSEHFFDVLNQACYIKSPYDIIAGTLREFNSPVPPYTDWQNGYPVFENIYQKASEMQQELFLPPDVSGWPSYYQDPMYYELWVNSNSLPKRADFTDALVADSVVDVRAFANSTGNPSDPNQLIDEVTTLLLRYPLSANSKTYIKQNFLINNTGNDTVWTTAWNANDPSVNTSLRNMFTFIMNLPEFHLC
jgi:uncharacterized protein (DUF1800 family)